jgi:hypothetical protein
MPAGNATRPGNPLASVPQNARIFVFPADRKSLVHLNVLTGLDTAAAENALVWVVAIKRIGKIFFEGLGNEGTLLMGDVEERRRIVNRAVAVVVVTDGAVQQMVMQDAIEGIELRIFRPCGFCNDGYRGSNFHATSADELTIDLHHAGIAGLNGPKLGVIADLGDFPAAAIDGFDEKLSLIGVHRESVDG